MDVNFPGGNFTEVTVDSGAEESVRPCNWREQLGLHKAPKELHLVNASGAVIPHYVQRVVRLKPFSKGRTA